MNKPLSIVTGVVLALAAGTALAQAPAAKPSQPAVCNNCHKPEAGVIRGNFENVAFKSQSIQLNLGSHTENVQVVPSYI